MLEIQIGENISLKSANELSPMLILGSTGQGKTTTLEQIVLELARNKQTGFLYDPYGDLSADIKKLALSEEAREHFAFFDEKVETKKLKKALSGKFVIVAGDKFKNGGRKTRELACSIVKFAAKNLQKNSWLVVDEALENISDEIFEIYLCLKSKGINLVLSDVSLINLSEIERKSLLSCVKTYVVYKIRNIDAKWLEKANKKLVAKSIAAIKQYHFQALIAGKLQYSPSIWPLKAI